MARVGRARGIDEAQTCINAFASKTLFIGEIRETMQSRQALINQKVPLEHSLMVRLQQETSKAFAAMIGNLQCLAHIYPLVSRTLQGMPAPSALLQSPRSSRCQAS